jgi:hypothetical protein
MNLPVHTTTKLLAFTFIACIVLTTSAHAKGGYPSLGMSTRFSGNGLAAAPALSVRYSLDRIDFDFGANFQMRDSRFSGVQANACWYVVPPVKKVRLGFFCGLRYFHSALLNTAVTAQEKWKQPESKLNFDELRMRCVEAQAGFGIRVQHSHHVSTFYGVGLGAYQTVGDTHLYEGMHREINRAELSLDVALSYSFR